MRSCVSRQRGGGHENQRDLDRLPAGISGGVCVNHLWPVVAGGGGMTKDEALDLALEALEKSVATCFDRYAHEQVMSRPEHFINQAITAIKQARALDKKAENARELGLDYEPVLKDNSNYRYDPPVAEPVQSCYCPNCEAMGKELAALKAQPAPVQEPVSGVVLRDGLPALLQDKHIKENDKRLYTTPPAAPVPLTDGEIRNIGLTLKVDFTWEEFARAIEAKLKEKNNG